MERIKSLTPETVLIVGQMIPIIAKIGGDITGSKEVKIFWKKPSGTVGNWVASIYNAPDGQIRYDTGLTDIDEHGDWIFWGWQKDANDKENAGKAVKIRVYNQGEVPKN